MNANFNDAVLVQLMDKQYFSVFNPIPRYSYSCQNRHVMISKSIMHVCYRAPITNRVYTGNFTAMVAQRRNPAITFPLKVQRYYGSTVPWPIRANTSALMEFLKRQKRKRVAECMCGTPEHFC